MVENHHNKLFGSLRVGRLSLVDHPDMSIYIRVCIDYPSKLQLIRAHPHRGQRTNITTHRNGECLR